MATFNEDDLWSEEFRTRAANNAYHSIEALERATSSWTPDRFESAEENDRLRNDLYNSNLNFLKGVLNDPYYEGFIDRKRVQDAIDAAESNPPVPSTSLS